MQDMVICPMCGGKSFVTTTRVEVRRRKCMDCKRPFYTQEVVLKPQNGQKNLFHLRVTQEEARRDALKMTRVKELVDIMIA